LELAMLNAVSHHGLCDAEGNLLRDHAVTTQYFRRLMFRYAKHDEAFRSELQKRLRFGCDHFFGRIPEKRGKGGYKGFENKWYIEQDLLRYDQQVDSLDSVVNVDERFLMDREFTNMGSTKELRNALKSKSSHLLKRLKEKGALERIALLDGGQEYVVFPTNERYTCYNKPKTDLNYSNQLAIPQKWITEQRQLPGTLDDLEYTMCLGIHSSFVEQAPGFDDVERMYSGLCMLSRMTGKEYPDEMRLLVNYMVDAFNKSINRIKDNETLKQSHFHEELLDCMNVMRQLKPEEADNMQREYVKLMKGK